MFEEDPNQLPAFDVDPTPLTNKELTSTRVRYVLCLLYHRIDSEITVYCLNYVMAECEKSGAKYVF